ncbi:MAG: hypothetical protein M3N57_05235 [Actinomycetota bacterium]|nr:hypothetical protein [Actinomycetota bacterium]
MRSTVDEVELAEIRDELMTQARLFEDPLAYVAGVEDTLDAVRRALRRDRDSTTIVVPQVRPTRML